MMARFQIALKALELGGHTPVVRGLLWMQGEQDSKRQESAASYAANLKYLRDRVVSDLGLQELPLVFGQVLPYSEAKPRFVARDVIRAQMAAADQGSGAPESIKRARMVSTDGFGLHADTVHYNADGQWQLGVSMACAMQELRQMKR
ncbi:hypothetical protein G3M56_004610 [Sulfuriroseicoccus oceanibius]|uniref:Sialate O-acetylesterase domain-containing protein n=1 Tax=Sulfuriroseicoccus oceanibius TaxID=2707525 RepID=A0A7T7F334_9BACT|nr:hypothetical protein G3M56_004610 [Sulfuriroseicoccus oceanibius]